MTVHFIGAGPGAADLITVRGRALIAASPTCLYSGNLVQPELLASCPPGARVVDTDPLTLDEVIAEFVAAHEAGRDVARPVSGDPSLFSVVAEEMDRLTARGVPYDVTPGVPSFAAAAAILSRELTVPGVAETIALTRAGEDLGVLGRSRATIVLHLAMHCVDEVVAELLPGYGADCPVAVVARASWADEVVLRGTLADIAEQVARSGLRRTAVIIVGAALTADSIS
jgi:precorrin-4/cobalt-precorrin-4 C11-methyltransferase